MYGLAFVIGSCVVDLVFYTKSLPSQGQTVLATFKKGLGGKGFNQAVAAQLAGAEVVFTGSVGNDPAGAQFDEALEKYGITNKLFTSSWPTGMASITVDSAGNNSIAVALGANESLTKATIPDGCEIVLAQLETNIPVLLETFKEARRRGITTVLNPAPMPDIIPDEFWTLLAYTDILTPNETELEAITETQEVMKLTDLDLVAVARTIPSVQHVIVTLGGRGALQLDNEIKGNGYTCGFDFTFHQAPTVKAVDTTGAGDAFNGGLIAGLLKHDEDLTSAIEYAIVVASLSVQKEGTSASLPTILEITNSLETR